MKIFLVVFVLLSFASSQTLPINGATYESDSQHLDFRKCVWEKCSLAGCNCGYILNDEFLKFEEEKLGTCIGRQKFCSMGTACTYYKWEASSSCYLRRSVLPPTYERKVLRYTFWIIGFLVIVGNTYVIVSSFVRTSCFKQAWPSASLHCNHIVILNIAVADFIMGVYLIAISIIHQVFRNDEEWIGSLGCSILGSLVMISSEASCFLMVTLTSFRLFHVYRPLSSRAASSWPWKVCIFMCWFVAVFLGVFPILESTDYFVQYYMMESAHGDTVLVRTNTVKIFVFIVISLDRSNCSNHVLEPELKFVNSFFPQYTSQDQFEHFSITKFSDQDCKILRDIVKVAGDIYRSYTPKRRLKYYDSTELCVPQLLIFSGVPGWEYTIALLTLNLICFFFIAVSYILIYMRSTKKRPINAASTVDLQKREGKMQKRIARIIITDFACWVPFCVIGFVTLGRLCQLNDIIAEISIGFLLPINSALNPFLYSVGLSKLFKRLRCLFIKRCKK